MRADIKEHLVRRKALPNPRMNMSLGWLRCQQTGMHPAESITDFLRTGNAELALNPGPKNSPEYPVRTWRAPLHG